ncbi:hypothetical protein [uncultured Alistipes sp.]|uniref:hypothetical protein n=1 Tax=uncultured Alistipes sp. TaxID=538949 RepID=UPI0025986019|nr:hypothetical protein [uncultured Alistipes sp.]
MNPKYRFFINDRECAPYYKDDLSLDTERESSRWFFRSKLSGKLNFIRDDFDYIDRQPISTTFQLRIERRNATGWAEYYRGRFFKTDCEFDRDNRIVTVVVDSQDNYVDILKNYDSEENLIPLAPDSVSVKTFVRPLLEVYLVQNGVGSDKLSVFQGNHVWEKETNDSPSDENTLVNTYHFAPGRVVGIAGVAYSAGNWSLLEIDNYCGTYTLRRGSAEYQTRFYVNSKTNYCLREVRANIPEMWLCAYDPVTDKEVGGALAIGMVVNNRLVKLTRWRDGGWVYKDVLDMNIQTSKIYQRVISAVGNDNQRRSDSDITDTSLKVYPFAQKDYTAYEIVVSNEVSSEPTEWGRAENGGYFVRPANADQSFFPVFQSRWATISYWMKLTLTENDSNRREWVINDCYDIGNVIKVLLQKFAPEIKHEPLPEYSEFLYFAGDATHSDLYKLFPKKPTSVPNFRLMICPKSNLLSVNYDKPAQIAKTSLQSIFNMLRDVYQLYWYIDDDKRLHIEHLQWFLNGGSYAGTGSVSVDLTKLFDPRTRKAWSFGTAKWNYDKGQLPDRFEFEWPEDAGAVFNGYPIEVKAPFVTDGKKEQITVGSFMSDIDTMLYNSGSVSSDGFVLLAANDKFFGETAQTSGWMKNDGTVDESYSGSVHRTYDASAQNIAGQTVKIRCWGSSTYPGCVCLDADRNVLQCYLNTTSEMTFMQNKQVLIPADTKYIVLNYAYRMGMTGPITTSRLSSLYQTQSNPLACVWNGSNWVPDHFYYQGRNANVQNFWASFLYIAPKFYVYDLPSDDCVINNGEETFGPAAPIAVQSISKALKQQIDIPSPLAPRINPYQLVRTALGNGMVEKISLNLSSDKAEVQLKYELK